MAALLADAGSILEFIRSPASTVPIRANHTAPLDTVGDLRGPPTAGFSTTAPPRVPTGSLGASARNSSGGTKTSASGSEKTFPTSRKTRHLITAQAKMPRECRLLVEISLSSCIRTVLDGCGSQAD